MKIAKRERVKQLIATPLNSLNQGQTWQRQGIDTRTAREKRELPACPDSENGAHAFSVLQFNVNKQTTKFIWQQ